MVGKTAAEKAVNEGGIDCQLVTVPITETPEQAKQRMKRGEPLPHFSYMACTIKQQGESK